MTFRFVLMIIMPLLFYIEANNDQSRIREGGDIGNINCSDIQSFTCPSLIRWLKRLKVLLIGCYEPAVFTNNISL